MKIDRLMGIVTLLLQEEKLTAPELAERFEVSRRTISRDIEDLCRAGIPVVTEQGFGGGISIAPGYKLDKTFLTEEEMQAVAAGLQGLDSVSATSYGRRFFDKLPGSGGQADFFMVDLASFYQESLVPKIELLKRAFQAHRLVSFRYYNGQGEQERCIEPYRAVFRWGAWYVLGFCTKREDFRLFKLNRLWELRQTEQAFFPREIPPGALRFDSHFCETTIQLKAVFRPEEKHRLIDEYGWGCFTEREDGSLLFEWDFSSYDRMKEWILCFGGQAEVLEPEALRRDIAETAARLLSVYRKAD